MKSKAASISPFTFSIEQKVQSNAESKLWLLRYTENQLIGFAIFKHSQQTVGKESMNAKNDLIFFITSTFQFQRTKCMTLTLLEFQEKFMIEIFFD